MRTKYNSPNLKNETVISNMVDFFETSRPDVYWDEIDRNQLNRSQEFDKSSLEGSI